MENKAKKIAIITGASSGIGKSFCFEVDKLGLDEIWGIALKTKSIEKMKKELKTTFKFFDLDLTKEKSFALLEQELQKENLTVEWLVNASGYGKFGRYDDTDIASQTGMVDLNCRALTHLTLLCLPFMHKGGRIVQIGSVASFQPVPYIAVYGATKAYVLSYSRALNRELKSRGISVTCVCPFWTKTAFFDRATQVKTKEAVIKKYVAMYDTDKVVKRGMKGALKRKEVVLYGFKAKAQVYLGKLLPHKWILSIWIKQQKFNKTYKNK